MLMLDLLDLFVKSVVLRNYIRQVLKHLRIFVVFVLRPFVFYLFIFRTNFFNDLVFVRVLLGIYREVFALDFVL